MLQYREKEEKERTIHNVSQSIQWGLILNCLEGSIEKCPAMSID